MAKKSRRSRSLAAPIDISPVDNHDRLQVVIETPKGSRNKYAFDAEQKIFLKKVLLPAGMAFPCDCGFVPSTTAEDDDPTDVLVLMDEPAFPGCWLRCRDIGVIEGHKGKKKNGGRNDRIIAIEEANHSYPRVRHIKGLGKKFLEGLEELFVNYHCLEGKKYTILDVKGPAQARRGVADGMRRYSSARFETFPLPRARHITVAGSSMQRARGLIRLLNVRNGLGFSRLCSAWCGGVAAGRI